MVPFLSRKYLQVSKSLAFYHRLLKAGDCIWGSTHPAAWQTDVVAIKHEGFEGNLKTYWDLKLLSIIICFLSPGYNLKGKLAFRDPEKLFNAFHIKGCIFNYMESRTIFLCSSSDYKSAFCWPSLFPYRYKNICIMPHTFFLPAEEQPTVGYKILETHLERGASSF